MSAFAAGAPGKIILCGEHAVVYNRPAIALPVTQVQAKTMVMANPAGQPGQVEIDAPLIDLKTNLESLSEEHPLALAIRGVQTALHIPILPACRMRITSTIPIASGLGSGAAVSVSIARALSAFCGHPLSDEQVSAIAFRVDQAYHGTPSGIDNTVITYAQPVFYLKDRPFERLEMNHPHTFIIGDSGISSPTHLVVGDVRRRWTADPTAYEAIFERIGAIAWRVRECLATGDQTGLGAAMSANHALLQQLDVSCPELDRLVDAAMAAGAAGAKLSGGGRGGNMIALVAPSAAEQVAHALQAAGAVRTIITQVG